MRNLSQKQRSQRNGILFALPWMIGFCVFMLYPMLQALYFSFTNYSVLRGPAWNGLDNYIEMFTQDPLFWKSLVNSLYMVAFGMTITIIITLCVSLLLNDKRLRGISFFRVIFFIPTLVPIVIMSILWIWMFRVDNGFINELLKLFGIQGPSWLASPAWSKPAMIIMKTWCAGNLIIIFLGGLQDVPEELYEAADIDGGNFLHKTVYITIPMLKNVLVFNIITTMINMMQTFAEAQIMTDGGPMESTYYYALYLYNNAFKYGRMGYASAMAWIMLIITMILSIVTLRASGMMDRKNELRGER